MLSYLQRERDTMRKVVLTVCLGVVFALALAIPSADADPVIDRARAICQQYGFKVGTESFANCTMQEANRQSEQGQLALQRQKKCAEIRKRIPAFSAEQSASDKAKIGPRGSTYEESMFKGIEKELQLNGCL